MGPGVFRNGHLECFPRILLQCRGDWAKSSQDSQCQQGLSWPLWAMLQTKSPILGAASERNVGQLLFFGTIAC